MQRADCREFLILIIIFLKEIPLKVIKFEKTGACH